MSDEDTPRVGVVVRHAEPKLLVTLDTDGDTTHHWIQMGWVAQDD